MENILDKCVRHLIRRLLRSVIHLIPNKSLEILKISPKNTHLSFYFFIIATNMRHERGTDIDLNVATCLGSQARLWFRNLWVQLVTPLIRRKVDFEWFLNDQISGSFYARGILNLAGYVLDYVILQVSCRGEWNSIVFSVFSCLQCEKITFPKSHHGPLICRSNRGAMEYKFIAEIFVSVLLFSILWLCFKQKSRVMQMKTRRRVEKTRRYRRKEGNEIILLRVGRFAVSKMANYSNECG